MIRSIDARLPSVLGGRVLGQRAALALLAVEVLPVGSLLDGVVVPEETPPAKFRDEKLDDVFEGAGFDGVGL